MYAELGKIDYNYISITIIAIVMQLYNDYVC